MTKQLVTVVALVEIEAGSDGDARTIGGNIARQIQGAIPSQYDVKGVEVSDVKNVDETDTPLKSDRKAGERDVTSGKTQNVT